MKTYVTHINIYPNNKDGNEHFLSFNTILKEPNEKDYIYQTQDIIDCLTSAIDTYKQISSNHKIWKKIYNILPIIVKEISNAQKNDIVQALETYNEMFNLSYVRIYSIKQRWIEEKSEKITNYPNNIRKSIKNAEAIMQAAKTRKKLKYEQRYGVYIPTYMKAEFEQAVKTYNEQCSMSVKA